MKHKLNKEILVHMNCGECNQWWSMADNQTKKPDQLWCPHCGHRPADKKKPDESPAKVHLVK